MTEEQISTLVDTAVRETLRTELALPAHLADCTLDELNVSSIDLVETVVTLEQRLGTVFTDSEINPVRTVRDLERLVRSRVM